VALTLITMLGRTPKDATIGYRSTIHTFPDGTRGQPTAFFGWSIRHWLRPQPERLVILGTVGSMWDYLFETADLDDSLEGARLALLEPTEQKCVDQPLLDRWTPKLQQHIGCELKLVVIPYARDEAEQLRIVETMAEHVGEGDRVHLDVTHGLRHLPMLALVSALYLRHLRGAAIEKIWYAAFDPDTGEAPVYDLAGLLRVVDWVGALQSFDKDGDYAVFDPLLETWALPERNALREAAYLEQVSRIREARGKLRGVDAALSREPPTSVAGLFAPRLRERIAWIHGHTPYQHQRRLALRHLEQGDILRCSIFAYEAFVTRQVQQQDGDPADRKVRDEARRTLEDHMKTFQTNDARVRDYRLLRGLRNHFAHGNRAENSEVERVAGSAESVRAELRRVIASLLPDVR
jgi:CRISPR-associated Csx2 family protein